MLNQSIVTEFLLLGFSDIWEWQVIVFVMFLVIYMVSLIGNLLVLTVIATSRHVHTPMYFFLMNLSVLDLGSISTIIPKAMANSVLNTRLISYYGCAAQVFFIFFFCGSELFILTVMAYDRYIAICDPLHYEMEMNRRVCFQMAIGAWMAGLLYGIIHTICTFLITFCSNVINQFFCEVPQLLRLSCSNLYLIESGALVLAVCVCTCFFAIIMASYVRIFRTVIAMTSIEAKRKTFMTCIPHLTVVSSFLGIGSLAYAKPVSDSPSNWDLAVSLMYSVIPPIMNPIIYSIRNKEIKAELYKRFYWMFSSKRTMSVFQPNA